MVSKYPQCPHKQLNKQTESTTRVSGHIYIEGDHLPECQNHHLHTATTEGPEPLHSNPHKPGTTPFSVPHMPIYTATSPVSAKMLKECCPKPEPWYHTQEQQSQASSTLTSEEPYRTRRKTQIKITALHTTMETLRTIASSSSFPTKPAVTPSHQTQQWQLGRPGIQDLILLINSPAP